MKEQLWYKFDKTISNVFLLRIKNSHTLNCHYKLQQLQKLTLAAYLYIRCRCLAPSIYPDVTVNKNNLMDHEDEES